MRRYDSRESFRRLMSLGDEWSVELWGDGGATLRHAGREDLEWRWARLENMVADTQRWGLELTVGDVRCVE